MGPRIWIVVAIAVLVLLIVLEGKRQERIYGKSRRRGLMRTGLLELQQLIEPERKMEVLIEERDDELADDSAAPPDPGRAPRGGQGAS